ncbi:MULTISPECIES: NAD-dependent epimerase/dehydratase family protein [Geobacter]|uniref:NAD-dependent epimerase/dehydratase family protein n=1 Tax=Geobacter TaxID=28231 RepID=UPI0025727702|nr:SDR family oxidoreductase [Geobacter sulfurreducens]BEH11548.1 NAD-dependent epimerase/dehydratase family protein [Geobacter sulfurreducens subsp. ethanolicus]BET59404.1 NAD-dependent epimerase/dehydratase family protein [Geobacter sp. 60473]
MRILITGGLGHIGSQLMRDLPGLLPGVEIIVLDNLSTQRYCSLFNLPEGGKYRFLEGDVFTCNLDEVLEGVDAVIHLAAITDAANSFDNRDRVELVNFDCTERIARACMERGCALIFLSTTSVYGTQNDEVNENCTLDELQPQSPYAESKLKAELMLKELGKTEGLQSVTLRFGTIFGISPGMRFHTAVNKFVWQACMGCPITVWRTAMDQKRPYLDLGDATRALAFVIERRIFDSETYNVLTINATVREIVDAVRKQVDDVKVELVDTKIMNQLSYNVSRRKFENLGFTFTGKLEEGIARSVALLKRARSI